MSNFINLTVIKVPLTEVCRCCLLKYDNMTSFYPKTPQNSDLIAMLSSIGNFEVEMNEIMPWFICTNCETKLRISHDFQQLVQKTNETIKNCLVRPEKVHVFDAHNNKQSEPDELVDSLIPVDDIKVEEPEPEIVAESKTRLSLFPHIKIEEALQESHKSFCQNAKCIKCGFQSSNLRALSAHMSYIHKEMKNRWCLYCNMEVEDLKEHTKTEKHIQLVCKLCNKQFTNKGHLHEHLLSHSEDRPFKCNFKICGADFASQRLLRKHAIKHQHQNESNYTCVICNQSFIVRENLDNHLKLKHLIETGDKKLIQRQNFCFKCNRKVRRFSTHWKLKHDPKDFDEKQQCVKHKSLCNICGKQYSSSSKLRMHIRTHTNESPYKCQFCDKRTHSKHQLVCHERTHTGEKPYKCTICDKSFAQTGVLKTHMKLHTGKPEKCPLCEKTYCRPAHLRVHMRQHTGEKPFVCNQCGMGFPQKGHLTEHMRGHSDDRPFKCNICAGTFRTKATLRHHIQIHTGNKPYKCDQCPYACHKKYRLDQHRKQHQTF